MKKKLSGLLLLLCVVCFAVSLFACKNTFIKDQIVFKNIIIDKDNFGYIKVSNGETLFNFSQEIVIKGNASYFVSSDVDGVNRISEEVVSLKVGNNTFYVTQMVGEENTLYTLTIRRRPVYTVSFNSDGGTEVESQFVEEDSFASNPQEPTKAAYYFDGWDYDFTKPISEEVVVKARWIIDERLNQFDYTSTAMTCEITGVKDKSITSVEIPEYVTSIGKGAFDGCSISNIYIKSIAAWCKIAGLKNLMHSGIKRIFLDGKEITKLIIPAEVTKINDYAFHNCVSLINVVISKGVTNIGDFVFVACYNLSNVTIADTITDIGARSFSWCSGLKNLVIPNSVVVIGDGAFEGCSGLTSITIPKNVMSIGSQAFYGCGRLIEVINKSSLNIQKGNENNGYIGYYALNIKESGTSDIVNKNGYLLYTYDGKNYLIGYLGNETELELSNVFNDEPYEVYCHAFQYCNFTSIVMPNKITKIGDYAFRGCLSLTSIVIPDSVISMGDYVFQSCIELTDIKISKNTTRIGNQAFVFCRKLTSITIPNCVSYIGPYSFSQCQNLINIEYNGSRKQWNDISKDRNWKYGVPEDCVVHCTDGDIKI